MLKRRLIEELGGFDSGNGSIENLSARIANATDTDLELTFRHSIH
jgi:hypothetical protein